MTPISYDDAVATLEQARDTCPNPLDALTERQRREAQSRLLRINHLRDDLRAAHHAHRVAAERLAAVIRDADPIRLRVEQIQTEIDALGDINGFDHSSMMTTRWRRREVLQEEQRQHAAYLRALTTRREELTQREQDAHARLTQTLHAIAALEG